MENFLVQHGYKSRFMRSMSIMVSGLDMYKKVPVNLMDGAAKQHGGCSYFSFLALFVIVLLFAYETKEFTSITLVKNLIMDKNEHTGDTKIRLNFNITMLELQCEWCVIDVVSVLGTEQNVSAHITKWDIDMNRDGNNNNDDHGIQRRNVIYKGRNRNQKDIDLHDTTVLESIEELQEQNDGRLHAISLNQHSLQAYQKESEYLFVDFYASWCSHCRTLEPTWEILAQMMNEHHIETTTTNSTETKREMNVNEETKTDDRITSSTPTPIEGVNNEANNDQQQQVTIAKIDCGNVNNSDVCNEHDIKAYPTLRLFIDGNPWRELFTSSSSSSSSSSSNGSDSDYTGHRTILEMIEWLHFVEQQVQDDASSRTFHIAHKAARNRLTDDTVRQEEHNKWNDKDIQKKKQHHHTAHHHTITTAANSNGDGGSGCQLVGHLLLDRTPGNFHILARSKHHDLNPAMTNVSHIINELYVGDPTARHWIKRKKFTVPGEVEEKLAPLNHKMFINYNLEESYHHYLKLIATKIDGMKIGRRELVTYQMIANSQLAYYDNGNGNTNDTKTTIPEAKFAYDLSPIAVKYKFQSRKWYDYLTSIFAIIGGVFTVVEMLEGFFRALHIV